MQLSAHHTKTLIAAGLLFVSGVTALVYEVLWLRELSLLFGNSAQAAAATTAAFFAGLAAGNAFWGKRSTTALQPLRAYGWLELGVASSAVLYFLLLAAYQTLYGTLYAQFAETPAIFLLIKFALAFALFFPTAFFMGGTFPMLTQYVVQRRDALGTHASLLYATNTIGAAVGASLAGFLLPWWLGVKTTYALTMAATGAIALVALWLGSRSTPTPTHSRANSSTSAVSNAARPLEVPTDSLAYPASTLTLLAALSGFTTLALQVLWIRMFAQVLHNSVYSYATILAVFLLSLGVGAALARRVATAAIHPRYWLPAALAVAALLVAASPLAFSLLTNGAAYLGGDANFVSYIGRIIGLVTVCIGIPMLIIGSVLPYLFKLAEQGSYGPGESVGRLITWNTLAGIAGSIVAGFFLLGWIGLWKSILLVAMLYLAGAIWLLSHRPRGNYAQIAITAVVALLVGTVMNPTQLPTVRLSAKNTSEHLLQVWEGADATVAVIERDGFLRTKLNNWYALGSTSDMLTQQIQSHLPLLLHGDAQDIYYLGLGTGITAGTALSYPVQSVLVAEIAPSVIKASKEYFGEHTNGLFKDSRARVVAEDGRTLLLGLADPLDLIISDLFIPWRAGVGTLYSANHYRAARDRLRLKGLYVQWLPLYQMTREEFGIIARSMRSVFPRLTLWRGSFWADRPVVALVGHNEITALTEQSALVEVSRAALAGHIQQQGDSIPLLSHYLGQVELDDPLLREAQLNTDNQPIIEYLAPVNHRRQRAGLARWFMGDDLLQYQASRLSREALTDDNYIAALDRQWHAVIQAGYYLQVSQYLRSRNNPEAEQAKATYETLLQEAAPELLPDS